MPPALAEPVEYDSAWTRDQLERGFLKIGGLEWTKAVGILDQTWEITRRRAGTSPSSISCLDLEVGVVYAAVKKFVGEESGDGTTLGSVVLGLGDDVLPLLAGRDMSSSRVRNWELRSDMYSFDLAGTPKCSH